MTCWPRASVPATTARSSWSPRSASTAQAAGIRPRRAGRRQHARGRRLDRAATSCPASTAARGRDRQRLPEGLAPGRLDLRPAQPGARPGGAGRHARHRPARAGRWRPRRSSTTSATCCRASCRCSSASSLLLSFLLLMAVFRSLADPADRRGHEPALGRRRVRRRDRRLPVRLGRVAARDHETGPIEAFLPVLMFPILFGLSMDYEVFLISRIYEEWHRRGDNREAVTHGLAATGRTITAAAAIMVLVFGVVRARRRADHRAVRRRPGQRRAARRADRPLGARPGADDPHRRAQLVAARPGWTAALPHLNVEGSSARGADGRGSEAPGFDAPGGVERAGGERGGGGGGEHGVGSERGRAERAGERGGEPVQLDQPVPEPAPS